MKMSMLSLEAQRILEDIASGLAEGLARCLTRGGYLKESSFVVVTKLIKSISIYMIYPRGSAGETHCKLIGGYPAEDHGIGLDDNIEKHPDIQSVCESESCEILIIDSRDASKTGHFREIIVKKGIKSIVLVPIRIDKKVVGVIAVDIFDGDNLDIWLEKFLKRLGISISIILQGKLAGVCSDGKAPFPCFAY
jgi:transcriptional regulator with GAF, ATPase, and Fis domain